MATSKNEPIAIVGSGCRFPGEASSPSKLWELLHRPRDLTKKPPSNRFNADGFFHPDGEHHGTANVTQSYFLEEDYRVFDASFFNITPKEAEAIDPQQRLLLETVYEALETAGISIKDLQGTKTAAYVGLMCNDFNDIQFRDPDYLPQYIATGSSRAIISNRLSYFFDWRGPSMTIDTACSSSLVAVHQAVQVLRSGESRVACAAGANLLIGPEYYLAESNLHMLSPSGRSQMWSANADGYARGEATGAFILKKLSDALADGDSIEAIIRETGVNSDGRTKGITMPSSDSQAALMRDTYAKAGLDPLSVQDRPQYFEAHGTGTQAGDPQEAGAIAGAFFNKNSKADEKLYVGSIKTVVGHTEGTAGVAGVLKASLAMQHGIIPPNQHLQLLNPSIEPFYKHLEVPTEPIPWPTPPAGMPMRASINSFGFGGTNAHCILEKYDPSIHVVAGYSEPLEASASDSAVESNLPILLSASAEKSLSSAIEEYSEYLKRNPQVNIRDLAWTLQARRSAFPVKIAFSNLTREGIIAQMDKQIAVSREKQGAEVGVRARLLNPESGPRILGVFTGQGAQWPTMGRGLILKSKLFRESIEKCEKSLAELPDAPSWSIKAELMAPPKESRLNEAYLSQPLCTAVQVGLVDLLTASGVKFHTVVGHSSGEIGAAYASGSVTAHDAIRIAYYRGLFAKLAKSESGKPGAMLAAGLTFEEAKILCNKKQFKGRIAVAASNAPGSVTLSGDDDAIEEAKKKLEADSKFARRLVVDTAYHSPHMIPCAEPYLTALATAGIQANKPNPGCVWLSSVYKDNGKPKVEELLGPYWRDNMNKTVLFSQAVTKALEIRGPFDVVLEVGPHAALKGPATQTMKEVLGAARPYQGALNRQKDDVVAFGDALGFLWVNLGVEAVDFTNYTAAMDGLDAPHPKVLKELPLYSWDHSLVHWRESRMSKRYRNREPHHELLGSRTPDDTDLEMRWRNLIKPNEIPWLKDHRLQGRIIVPGAAYAAMALEAARKLAGDRPIETIELYDLELENAIGMKDDTSGVETIFSLTPLESKDGSDSDSISAEYLCTAAPADGSGPIKKTFGGKVRVHFGGSSSASFPSRDKSKPMLYPMNLERFYNSMGDDVGLNYTGSFRGLTSVDRRMYRSTAKVAHPVEADGSLIFHPILLDVCFQAIFAAYASPGDGALWTSFLPRRIGRLLFNVAECQAHAAVKGKVSLDAFVTQTTVPNERQLPIIGGDIHVFNDASTKMLVQIEDLIISSFGAGKVSDDRELYTEAKYEFDVGSEVLIKNASEYSEREKNLTDVCERVVGCYLEYIIKEKVSPEEIVPAFQSFVPFAESVSNEEGNPSSTDIEDEIERLLLDTEESVDVDMIKIVADRLPSVLRGEQLMQEDEEVMQLLTRFYEQGIGFDRANSQISHTAKQIAHQHPRMAVLEIGAGSGSTTRATLEGLGAAFSSYTFTDVSAQAIGEAEKNFSPLSKKMQFKTLDIEKDVVDQGFADHSYDLVIASKVLHLTRNLESALQNVRRLLKPGGYLILSEPTGNLLRFAFVMSGFPEWWSGSNEGRSLSATLSPVKWDKLLRKTGFSGIDSIIDDNIHDKSRQLSSMIMSQATNDQVQFLRQPLQSLKLLSNVKGHLLIIGGKTLETARLIGNITNLLGNWQGKTTSVDALDTFDPKILKKATAVLCLQDLDEPFIKTFTPKGWLNLQQIVETVPSVLWVLSGSRFDNPYHAATIGMGRSIVAESPHFHLQFLDVGKDIKASATIAESALRLMLLGSKTLPEGNKLLWKNEPELIFEDGKFLIPRILPIEDLNDRLNSLRRVIKKDVNSAKHAVNIVASSGAAGSYTASKGQTLEAFVNPPQDHFTLRTIASTMSAVKITEETFLHVALGVDISTEQKVLAVTEQNSSIVCLPKEWSIPCPCKDGDEVRYLDSVVTYMMAKNIVEAIPAKGSTILHEPELGLATAACQMALAAGKRIICTTRSNSEQVFQGWIVLHAKLSKRNIISRVPRDACMFIDFSTGTNEGIHAMSSCLPRSCLIIQPEQVFALPRSSLAGKPISEAVQLLLIETSTLQKAFTEAQSSAKLPHVAANELVAEPKLRSPLTVINWSANELVSVQAKPIEPATLVADNKTYLLIGMTGELGQSLCRWMVQHGARYLVISSRHPQTDTRWKSELQEMGAVVRIESCDVTNKKDVERLVRKIGEDMPPIGGVINGAMILIDKPFGMMTYDDMRTVLRPKVDGSKNLDEVFWNTPLDFFLMTSSTAAVIGNPGQANYASANQYMVGLAAQRRKRGLAASVVDIGMIMGIGYIRRTEDQGTIEFSLTKQNIMPMAEADIHEVFAESIRTGNPSTGDRSEIITALQRLNLSDSTKRPSWMNNPKFSHHNYETDSSQKKEVEGVVSMKSQLAGAASVEQTAKILQEHFAAQLAVMLQLPPDGVNGAVPLIEMGIDSLAAVEIRTWFLTETEQDLPVLSILGGGTVTDLCDEVAQDIFANKPTVEAVEPQAAAAPAETVTVVVEADKSLPELKVPNASTVEPVSGAISTVSDTDSVDDDDTSDEEKGTIDTPPESEDMGREFDGLPTCPWDRIEPMSFGQQRIWFPSLYLEDKSAYNCTISYRLKGRLDIPKFARALRNVTQRHESLRTSFHTDSFTGEAKQDVLATTVFQLHQISSSDGDSDVKKEFQRIADHTYNLETGETMIATLVTHSKEYYTIIFGYHHIVMDGVSWQLCLQEFEREYNSPDASIAPPPQYPDFSLKQRQLVKTTALQKERAFWKSEFHDLPDALPLFPFAKTSSRKALSRYDTLDFVKELSPELTAKVKQASLVAKSTTFHFYMAAFQVLLYRFLDVDDMCLGVVDANRTDPTFMNTIGFMLNFLPLRFQLHTGQSFLEATQQTRNKAYAALGRSAVPIDTIIDDLQVPRSTTCPPLFQAIVNYRMGALKQKTMGSGIDLEWHDYIDARNPYDITISIDEKDDGTGGYISLSLLEYLFDKDHGDLLVNSYVHLLEQFAEDPSMSLEDASLFHENQMQRSLALGTGAQVTPDWPETVSLRIDELVKSQPTAQALVDAQGKRLNYQQMGERVESIASALQPLAPAGSRVGVFCEPSIDLICSLLAIMRIGAIYVPLDGNSPVERLALISSEAKPSVIIYDQGTMDRVSSVNPGDSDVLNVSSIPTSSNKTVRNVSKATEYAFMLFTSGSTGVPKGVKLTHANYVAHVSAASKGMGLGSEVVLQQSSVGFDLSLAQVFYGLANGGSLVITSNRGNPSDLTALMLSEKVTFTFCVPSEYSIMLRYGSKHLKECSSWRIALSSGESFPFNMKEKFRGLDLPQLTVFNAYGPTEASVVATLTEVEYRTETSDTRIPIGKTLDNYSVYVLDEELQPVPIGYLGQIHLGGPAISSGYLHRQDLTKEKFINDTVSAPEKRRQGWKTLYKTGDKAQMLSDGSIIYQGRIDGDTQIKLRGFRIELDEISNTILKSSAGILFDAAVCLRGGPDGFLVAFVVFSANKEPENPAAYLSQLIKNLPLPTYMKPSVAKALPQLPMTSSGKLDRRSLDAITLDELAEEEDATDASMTETEMKMKKVWEDILSETTGNSVAVKKDSDFFSVGGNSLLLLRLQAEIREAFLVNLPLAGLFQVNTISALAAKIDQSDGGNAATNLLDWEMETALPTALSSQTSESTTSVRADGGLNVVLTGSTGFLGRAILQQLVKQSSIARIDCIGVRSGSHPDTSSAKVQVYSGDLSKARLGLSEADAERIFKHAHVIIHNGADVSFMKSYQSLRGPNVSSTKELLSLAGARRIPFHFVSTAGVAHLTGKTTWEELSVAGYQPPTDGSDGYVASKWASERVLERASAQWGLPLWIHRPTSITTPDTIADGVATNNSADGQQSLMSVPSRDIVHNTLKYSRALRAIPDLAGWKGHFDFVSVISVAQRIVSNIQAGSLALSDNRPAKAGLTTAPSSPIATRFDFSALDAAMSAAENRAVVVEYVHHAGELVVPIDRFRAYIAERTGARDEEAIRTMRMNDWVDAAVDLGMDELVATFMRAVAHSVAASKDFGHGGVSGGGPLDMPLLLKKTPSL